MAGNNFNLENTFVQLLRYRCDVIDSLSVKLLNSTIIRMLIFLVFQVVTVLIMIKMTDIVYTTTVLVLDIVIVLSNIILLVLAYGLLKSPEKALLNDIIYNDYYRTHKVNNEIVMDNVSSADNLIGSITMMINIDRYLIVLDIVFSFVLIICWLITNNVR